MATTIPDLHLELIHREDHLYRLKMSLYWPGQDAPANPLAAHRPLVSLDPSAMPDPVKDGGDPGIWLGAQLLADPMARAAWDWVLGRVGDKALRLRLELDDELQQFPWELITLPFVGRVSLSERVLFSRFMFISRNQSTPKKRTNHLEITLALANPTDIQKSYKLPRPEPKQFLTPIHDLLLTKGSRVSVTKCKASLHALNSQLRRGCDILYLACHGGMGSEGPVVYLTQDEGNKTNFIKVSDFIAAWQKLEQLPRLVILVSCQSAGQQFGTDPLATLASQLVALGVPAVVAMQGNVLFDTAQTFLTPFFANLLADGIIDQAMAVARQTIADRPDAAVPVLFMRLSSGQLFSQDEILDLIDALRRSDDYGLFAHGHYFDLPVDVVAAEARHSLTQLDRSGTTDTGARNLNRAFERYFEQNHDEEPEILALIGAYGTNRTTQLLQIAWQALEQRDSKLLPLYISLLDFADARRRARDPILQLIYQAIHQHWPNISKEEVRELIQNGPRLRLLFDRGNGLKAEFRQAAWQAILDFAEQHPRHNYVLTAWPGGDDLLLSLPTNTRIVRFYIQRLASRKIRRFLQRSVQEPHLYEQLRRSRLADLATLPYFLVRILRQAANGNLARSRANFMQDLLDDGISSLGADTGMAVHALPFLQSLAWQTKNDGLELVTIDEAYDLLATIRGNREYPLEAFILGLIDAKILIKIGVNHLAFSNQLIQAFCCALALYHRPDRSSAIRDIVVTLGHADRRERWTETLVFLAALLSTDLAAFHELIFKIIDSVSIFESDAIALVARCLMQRRDFVDAQNADPDNVFLQSLQQQLIDALQWRLDPKLESQTDRAEQAVILLGQLAYYDPERIVPILTAVANQRVRVDSKGRADFHYSHVRFVALVALEQLWQSIKSFAEEQPESNESIYRALDRLQNAVLRHVGQADPDLHSLLDAWTEPAELDTLFRLFEQHVRDAEEDVADSDVAGLAALALGDLTSGRTLARNDTVQVVEFLQKQFLQLEPEIQDHTLWALTHALAMCPSQLIHELIVLPFVEKSVGQNSQGPLEFANLQRHKYMTYLIGRLRLRDETIYRFLREECLKINNMHLWIAVIDALGWITSSGDDARKQRRDLLENVALGNFDALMPDIQFSEREALYLRQRALTVLAETGDANTLKRLQALSQSGEPANPLKTPTTLLPQLHRTRQSILMRLSA